MACNHLRALKHLVTGLAMIGFTLSSASAMTDISALEKKRRAKRFILMHGAVMRKSMPISVGLASRCKSVMA